MKSDKQYDKEIFEFDTQTRIELNSSDTGAIPSKEEVTSDDSQHDAHDYRLLKAAYEMVGYEEEPDTKVPRSLRDSVAKTERGRIMQAFTENSQEADYYDENDEKLLDLLKAYNEGNLDEESMRDLEAELKSVVLHPRTRLTQMAAIKPILSEMTNKLDLIEAPMELASRLASLKTANQERKQAIINREWKKVDSLNQVTLKLANEIKAVLDMIRRSEPDRLYRLSTEIYKADPEMVKPYKTALIAYAKSHNSYQFSPELLEVLRKLGMDEKRGQFASALHSAYCNRPKRDNIFAFLQETSGIPGNRIMDVMHRAA